MHLMAPLPLAILLSLLHRTIIPELTFSVKGSPRCKESQFYSLPFGQAVTCMY